MTQEDIESMFTHSLDTFKAFDNLTIESSGYNQDECPATIWQILNHLVLWQTNQLNQIRGEEPGKNIAELDTWIKEKAPRDEINLQATVAQFKNQLEAVQDEIKKVGLTQKDSARKLKVIQELACHLSFHLGEVVLVRRLKGNYPLPHQMKAFLQT